MEKRSALYYLVRPIYTAKRILYKIYEKTHPNEPWISFGAVDFCNENLKKEMIGLEWGSGRSTSWFAERIKFLTSIEHCREWYDIVKKKLEDQHCTNVDYLYVALDHDESEPTHRDYDPVPQYVGVLDKFSDSSLDFVVVDGHYRMCCVKHVLSKISSGGYLLVDNSNWLKNLDEWGVSADFSLVHQSENVMSETTIWQKK